MSDWLALHLTQGFTAVEADALAYLLFLVAGLAWGVRWLWRRFR